MKELSVLIKPASSNCNLRCSYCFYSDISEQRTIGNHGIMSLDTVQLVIKRIADALEYQGIANICFQGGEPTIAGLNYFQYFVSCMNQFPNIHVRYSMQTNGTMIDETWVPFLKKHQFLLGVSLDGYQTNMNHFRFDAKKRSIYYCVLKTIDLLEKNGIEYNVLTVITAELAKHPKALFHFYQEHNMRYIQLIPCLPNLADKKNNHSLTPELYESFYLTFFNQWEKEVIKGNILNINLFENVMAILQGFPPYQCGMNGICTIQFVVEASGDVYPCDFYCIDQYHLGNLKQMSVKDIFKSKTAQQFLSESNCTNIPCNTCPYQAICNGGCRRQNICYLTETKCAHQNILNIMIPRLVKLLQK